MGQSYYKWREGNWCCYEKSLTSNFLLNFAATVGVSRLCGMQKVGVKCHLCKSSNESRVMYKVQPVVGAVYTGVLLQGVRDWKLSQISSGSLFIIWKLHRRHKCPYSIDLTVRLYFGKIHFNLNNNLLIL